MSLSADIESAIRQFDEFFPTIQPGEVSKMNQAIGMLNAVNTKIQQLGSTEPKKANDYVTEFNTRMGKVKELSQKPAPPKPAKTTTFTERTGPVKSTGISIEPDYEETTTLAPPPKPQPSGPVTLPADVLPIIAEFERIYLLAQKIDQNAVWTGKSNEVVRAWDAFLQNQAKRLVEVVREFGGRDEKLQDVAKRYNEFPDRLTASISRYDLDDRAKNVINKFNAEFQTVVNNFKSAPSKGEAERYYNTLQSLRSSLESLRVQTHPSVSAGLEASAIELQNMSRWLSQ